MPKFVDGRSVLPLAKGESVEWRNLAYPAGWPRLELVGPIATENWRQIRTTEFAYHYHPETGEEELYDPKGDPYQLENLLYGGVSDEEEAVRATYGDLSERMCTCSGAGCRAIAKGL